MSTTNAASSSDITDRLAAEFEGDAPRSRIEAVVASSLADLRGIPAPDLPELGERLARQRLLDLIDRQQAAVP
ncbi:three-helix bundle dimerization domain-containing protein [Rhodococcus aetherivorans]|uniref:three-helix bundle dimerization domain-containing protein n=1 Tax=Rhodococcus aetherivorans TaxID=191292 RepID=UPI003670E3D3